MQDSEEDDDVAALQPPLLPNNLQMNDVPNVRRRARGGQIRGRGRARAVGGRAVDQNQGTVERQ